MTLLVVVAGDHGESLGEHGESKHGFFIYNATLHVPLIVKFPRAQNAGKAVAESVSLVDIFPTVLQILQVNDPGTAKVQGKGLLSLILGKAAGYRPEIYAETYYPRLQFGWSELRALITETDKFVLAPKQELYHYRADFPENRNLSIGEIGGGQPAARSPEGSDPPVQRAVFVFSQEQPRSRNQGKAALFGLCHLQHGGHRDWGLP